MFLIISTWLKHAPFPWFYLSLLRVQSRQVLWPFKFLFFSLTYLPNPGFRACRFVYTSFDIPHYRVHPAWSWVFLSMHLKIRGMCVSQAWDGVPAYPDIWCYTFACKQHMLAELGNDCICFHTKENIKTERKNPTSPQWISSPISYTYSYSNTFAGSLYLMIEKWDWLSSPF